MTEYVQITEKQIITPLESFLQEVTPKHTEIQQPVPNLKTIESSLKDIFPEQKYDEKDISEIKKILGESSKELSTLELQCIIAEIQYLSNSWLDDFEKELFDGLTLSELLHEKGGGL